MQASIRNADYAALVCVVTAMVRGAPTAVALPIVLEDGDSRVLISDENGRTSMKILKILLSIVFVAISLSANAIPVIYQFDATILDVLVDTGAGTYTGTASGDTFSGSLQYSSDPGDAFESDVDVSSPPAVESKWKFSGGFFGGTLTDGFTAVNTDTMSLSIDSNFAVESQEEADFLNALLVEVGNPLIVAPGDLFDVWDSQSFDGVDGPNDGVSFGVGLITFDESLYTGFDFEPFPLDLLNYDIAVMFLEERIDGEIVFEGFGILDAHAVPEPGTLALLGIGLLGMGVARRTKV